MGYFVHKVVDKEISVVLRHFTGKMYWAGGVDEGFHTG